MTASPQSLRELVGELLTGDHRDCLSNACHLRPELEAALQRDSAAPEGPSEPEYAVAWAIDLAVRHLLSHPTDEHNLSLAVELLKAVRYHDDDIAGLFRRWDMEPTEAWKAQEALR